MPSLPPESPVIPAAPATPAGPKEWRAGTLVYTTAGVVTLFAWMLVGDFAWSMRERSVGPLSQWYLKQLNVSNFVFGLIITSLPAIIGLLVTPVVAYRSDRHRGPRGRRIPYLMTTTPMAAMGMTGIAVSPIVGPWLHLQLGAASPGETMVCLLWFGAFWTLFDFAQSASYAVFNGLVNDVVPSPLLGRFYGLFRMISLLDGIIFNYWLFGKADTHFTVILLSITGVYAMGLLWVCFRVKEGTYPPPPPPDAQAANPFRRFGGAVKTYARECFTNRYYLYLFLATTFGSLTVLPINTFSLPYARSLGVSLDTYGKLFAIMFTCSMGLAFFMGWLADLFHPLRIAIVVQIASVVTMLAGAFLATDARSFCILFVLQGVLAGCYNSGANQLLGLRLYPQVKYAQFASAAGLFLGLGTVAIAPAVGQLVDWTGNNYRYVFGACALFCAISVIFLFIVFSHFKRLGGDRAYVAPEG